MCFNASTGPRCVHRHIAGVRAAERRSGGPPSPLCRSSHSNASSGGRLAPNLGSTASGRAAAAAAGLAGEWAGRARQGERRRPARRRGRPRASVCSPMLHDRHGAAPAECLCQDPTVIEGPRRNMSSAPWLLQALGGGMGVRKFSGNGAGLGVWLGCGFGVGERPATADADSRLATRLMGASPGCRTLLAQPTPCAPPLPQAGALAARPSVWPASAWAACVASWAE